MRSKTEGVALAAIVAKETTHGNWSGIGAGLGLGTGGFNVLGGAAAGANTSQTQRARAFSAPKTAQFDILKVLTPLVVIAVALGFVGLASNVGMDSESTTGSVESLIASLTHYLFVIATVLLFVSVIFWLIFGLDRQINEETRRVDHENALAEKLKTVYYRLRYVENDHIVFDPVTGKESPAESDYINKLMLEIVTENSDHA